MRSRLTADPRVERLELRYELEKTRAGWHLLAWTLAVLAATAAQIAVGDWFAIALALSSAGLGVALDRWQTAGDGQERMQRDLRAITTIYHESPLTIRRWLTSEFINDSIRNLLAASLNSEDLGHGYWEQAVRPFLNESNRGFKTHWRYQIDLVDLSEPVELSLGEEPMALLEPDRYRRLHTSVIYNQSVPEPAEMCYVAIVFDGNALPQWFTRPNFLLREVAEMPSELVEALRSFPLSPATLPSTFDECAATTLAGAPVAQLAESIFSAAVSVGEEKLRPASLHLDRTGISWGFRLSEQLRDELRTSSEVRVDLATFISRAQNSFPVKIAAPTRNPTVQFNYGLTDIENVDTEVFFSAQRPWDARLHSGEDNYRRAEVLTENDDWVFAGSGCMFSWREDAAPLSSGP